MYKYLCAIIGVICRSLVIVFKKHDENLPFHIKAHYQISSDLKSTTSISTSTTDQGNIYDVIILIE